MAARCWTRRNRLKGYRKYLRKIDRHPDWVFILYNGGLLCDARVADRMARGDGSVWDEVRVFELGAKR